MLRVWLFVLTITVQLFSSEPNTIENSYIDITHRYISEKVENISNLADNIAVGTINYAKYINPKDVDDLFKNEKYIDETKKSYLRLSTDYSASSLESNDFNIKLSAKLALNKSRKKFHLFINGFKQNNIEDIIKKENDYDSAPEIGISYVTLLKNNIETKYSLSIKSLYPYVKGRFSYKKKINSWTIEPVQNIEYSIKDKFKEDTKLYIDKQVLDKVKFRLEFYRGTEEKSDGMDYGSVASIFWIPLKSTGLQLSQEVSGNTKYEYTDDEETKKYNNINSYTTTLTFRQNFYRKWLFYELSPGVNFHKNYDFEPNYRFYIRLDAFFGKM